MLAELVDIMPVRQDHIACRNGVEVLHIVKYINKGASGVTRTAVVKIHVGSVGCNEKGIVISTVLDPRDVSVGLRIVVAGWSVGVG